MAGVPEGLDSPRRSNVPAWGQSSWSDMGTAWNAVIEYTAAVAVYGGLGWFADRWLHTGHVLFLLGLLSGTGLGTYVLAKRASQADRTRTKAGQSDRASR